MPHDLLEALPGELVVGDPHHPKAAGREQLVSRLVAGLGGRVFVYVSVKLDSEGELATEEIEHESPEGILPPELVPEAPARPKVLPRGAFGRRREPTKLSCTVHQLAPVHRPT